MLRWRQQKKKLSQGREIHELVDYETKQVLAHVQQRLPEWDFYWYTLPGVWPGENTQRKPDRTLQAAKAACLEYVKQHRVPAERSSAAAS